MVSGSNPARSALSAIPVKTSPPTHVLHSFPTRRSSDLRALSDSRGASGELESLRTELEAAQAEIQTELTRSEEHTSELQSPYDLVCRLLLEKKKMRQLGLASCAVISGSNPMRSDWIAIP